MHMADGFISPAVGCTMWAASAAITALCARKVRQEKEVRLVPLMGVLGAFIFACQMLNFTIPGTGSSGHLGGGLILAVLLGPYAGFLVMAAILAVQALFFADGGLLALGCNIFNMGFFSCLVAYPFIYRPLAGKNPGTGRITLASITAAVIGLQLGAFSVVLETTASGISALPFAQFVELMLPIHLAIGVVEGLATAAIVIFISKAQPSLLRPADLETGPQKSLLHRSGHLCGSGPALRGGPFLFASAYPGRPGMVRGPASPGRKKPAWRSLLPPPQPGIRTGIHRHHAGLRPPRRGGNSLLRRDGESLLHRQP